MKRERLRVRLKIIGNARIENIGTSKLCVVYQLRMIFKRTRTYVIPNHQEEVRWMEWSVVYV